MPTPPRYRRVPLRAFALVSLISGCHLKCAKPVDADTDAGGSCDAGELSSGNACRIQDSPAALPVALTGAAAAVLGPFVYLAGGSSDGDNTAVKTVYVAAINADGSLGPLTSTTELPIASGGVATGGLAAVNGFLYYVGGESLGTNDVPVNSTFIAQVEADGGLDSWVDGPALPSARANLGVAAANGFLFAIGGDTVDGGMFVKADTFPSSPIYSAQLLPDGGLGEWNPTTPLPEGRSELAAVANGNFIYVVGGGFKPPGLGCENDEVLVGEATPTGEINSWTSLKSFPDLTEFCGAAVVENTLVVVAGKGTGAPNGSANILTAPLAADGTIAGDWAIAGEYQDTFAAYQRAVAASETAIYSFGGTNGAANSAATLVLDSVQRIPLSDGGVDCP